MATDPGGVDAAEASATGRILATPRQRLLAAAVAATVLVVGYLARPEEPVAARLEEVPGPLLQEVIDQRAPQAVFRTLQRVGVSSLPFVARIEESAEPAEFWSDLSADTTAEAPEERFGIVVGPNEILAEGRGLAVGDEVGLTVGDGRYIEGLVTVYFPDRELALIAADTAAPFSLPPRAATVMPGDAAVAVGLGAEGEVIAPVFVAAETSRGILAATPLDAFRGMGIFTEAGGLLGIVARSERGSRILRLEDALAPAPFREPIAPALGIALTIGAAEGSGGERAVRIAEVAPDGLAARMALRPDDVLLDGNGRTILTVEDARTLLRASAQAATPVRILREGRPITLRPPAAPVDSPR